MRRRRALAALAGLALVPLLAACGGSPYDIVQHQLPSGNGAFKLSHAIYAQNVVLVADASNSGTYSLAGTWVNNSGSDDAIIAVAADGTGVPNVIAGLPITLPAHSSTQPGVSPLATSTTGETFGTAPQIILSYATPQGAGQAIQPGRYMKIRIAYRVNGVIDMNVLVVPPIGYYAPFAPGASS